MRRLWSAELSTVHRSQLGIFSNWAVTAVSSQSKHVSELALLLTHTVFLKVQLSAAQAGKGLW